MDEKEIREVFASKKINFPDDGFTEQLTKRLPERNGALPQIIMIVFITAGFALTLTIQGVTTLIEQLASLVLSISQLSIPSPSAILAYTIVLVLTGMTGFALTLTDN